MRDGQLEIWCLFWPPAEAPRPLVQVRAPTQVPWCPRSGFWGRPHAGKGTKGWCCGLSPPVAGGGSQVS
jgi:hypothetical protein